MSNFNSADTSHTNRSDFRQLFGFMSEIYKKQVVTLALASKSTVSTIVQRALDDALNSTIEIPGFRKADQVPHTDPRLIVEVCKGIHRDNKLFGSILHVWLETNSDLMNTVTEYLMRFGLSTDGPDFSTYQFNRTQAIDAWRRDADAIHYHHDDFSRDDILLMQILVSGYFPVTEAVNKQNDAVDDIMSHCIDYLHALPFDSAEWDTRVQEFEFALRGIRADKQKEYVASLSLRLNQLVSQIATECADLTAFFDLPIDSWSFDNSHDSSMLSSAIETVEKLKVSLIEYQAIMTRAPKLEEEQRRRSQRNLLEAEIQVCKDELARYFFEAIGLDTDKQTSLESQLILPPSNNEDTAFQPTTQQQDSPGQGGSDDLDTEEVEQPNIGPPTPTEDEAQVADEQTRSANLDISQAEATQSEGAAQHPRRNSEASHVQIEVHVPQRDEMPTTERELLQGAEDYDSNHPTRFLRSSKVIAQEWCDGGNQELANEWTWALISEGDLPAAYWLAQVFNATADTTFVPSDVIGAVQAARWLAIDENTFVPDLMQIASSLQPASSEPDSLLRLSAALRPAVFAPASGMYNWIDEQSVTSCPSLRRIAYAIKEFAQQGIALHSHNIAGTSDLEYCRVELDHIVNDAKVLLERGLTQRIRYKPAYDVWHTLINSQGELGKLLVAITTNQQVSVVSVRKQIAFWSQESNVKERIFAIQANASTKGARTDPIQGKPLNTLLRNVAECCDCALRWCDLSDRISALESGGTRLSRQVDNLISRFQDSYNPAIDELASMCNDNLNQVDTVAWRCVTYTINQLAQDFNLEDRCDNPTARDWTWLTWLAENLEVALSRRLLLFPKLRFDDRGTLLTPKNLIHHIATDCIEPQSIQRCIEQWLTQQDFRFINILLHSVDVASEHSEVERNVQEGMDSARVACLEAGRGLTAAVEEAWVDGLITEEQRLAFTAQLPDSLASTTLNFADVFSLHESMKSELEQARVQRLEELRKDWESHRQNPTWFNIDSSTRTAIENAILASIGRQDTRVSEELLASLSEALADPNQASEVPMRLERKDNTLEQFIESTDRELSDLQSSNNLQKLIRELDNELLNRQPATTQLHRTQAKEALEAWRQLKQTRVLKPHALITLIEFLGIRTKRRADNCVKTTKSGQDWQHVTVLIEPSDPGLPIPQFGSMMDGRLDVAIMWKRRSADVLASRLRNMSIKAKQLIVFYMDTLTASQTHDAARTSKHQQSNPIFLDEQLLLFLARQPSDRLTAFLRCALPLTALNPYTPFLAGDVPPEMFFGRTDMIRELQDPSGSCIVYGGRQLGKSSLLRHVQRQFHAPEFERWAWMLDMKLIFDTAETSSTESMWLVLRKHFQDNGLISKGKHSQRPDRILDHILEAMTESTGRHVLVMFDEADGFLETDAANNFREVIRLRNLMTNTQRRFKVIFAGLHSVQRFDAIPDQPLAHFGMSLRVGPLEPLAAQQLVRNPLEALGFRFEDGGDVLRILSYTNYHPGLIQSFCKDLLNRLRVRIPRTPKPLPVTRPDIESVYRQPAVRNRIRDRFNWTLQLDRRYQAIVWTIILEQDDNDNRYTTAFRSQAILEIARSWWPAGFRNTSTEEVQSLLDEMCGLGVLLRNTQGGYQLRSPNLVPLIGSTSDIENQVLALAEVQPPELHDRNHYHSSLDDSAETYSPVTFVQEYNLTSEGFGVGMIFASEALGHSKVATAVQKLVSVADRAENFTTLVPGTDGTKMLEALNNRWVRKAKSVRSSARRNLIVFHSISTVDSTRISDLVGSAQRFCARHKPRTGQQTLRIIFLLDPKSTWAWLFVPNREVLEKSLIANVVSTRWNRQGVWKRLHQHDKMDDENHCDFVLQQTGGWHLLLDELFERNRIRKDRDTRDDATNIGLDLARPESDLREHFLHALGLDVSGCVTQVLKLVCREGPAPVDMIVPELFGDETTYSEEDYGRAVEFLVRMGCLISDGTTVKAEETVARVISST